MWASFPINWILLIAAINSIQIAGKDAHMVSALLKKFEEQLNNIKPVQKD